MRRIIATLITATATIGALLIGSVANAAVETTIVPRPLIGPECVPNVTTAVLTVVGGTLAPGTVIQYAQVRYDAVKARYVVEPCVVVVPAS